MKYAPGSDVDIHAEPGAPGYWRLYICDRGPGVPRDRQRELFAPFSRIADGDPARAGSSSGLRLSLAREIVMNAGGQLRYEDREGGGACFVVELPEAAALDCGRSAAAFQRRRPLPADQLLELVSPAPTSSGRPAPRPRSALKVSVSATSASALSCA